MHEPLHHPPPQCRKLLHHNLLTDL
jgi:hypothetical protein